MAVIDCNNRPEFTVKEVRGSGYIYSAQFTEASSISDITEAYTQNALDNTVPAIETFGIEETAEALATTYTKLLNQDRINCYNKTILTGTSTPEIALASLEANCGTSNVPKVQDVVILESKFRDDMFEYQFPAVDQRLKAGVISPIEFAEFAKDVGYSSMEQVTSDVNSNRFNFLKLLNLYLGGVALGSVLGSVCNILSSPFAGLTGIINGSLDAVSKTVTLKLAFLDVITKAAKLLDLGKAVAKIKAFQESFAKGLSGLIDGIKRKVENLIGNVNNTINGILNGEGIKAIGTFLQNKVNQIRNFFSQTNMDNLVERAKNSIGNFANQFKNMTGNIANFILVTMCKVSGAIQNFLEAPMKSLETLMGSVQEERNSLKNISDTALKKSIEGGRPSITEQSKKAKMDAWKSSYIESLINNAENKAQTQTQEQTDNDDRTKEYIYTPSLSTHPKPTEWKWLTFGGQVLDPVQAGQKFWDADFRVNMVDYGGGFVIPKETGIARDIGYYGLKLEVLERAEAVGEALQTKLTITSGFRHKIYNQYLRNTGVGAAKNSQHVQGKAIDVVMGRGNFREKFIQMAKVHGFKGIGRYNTFVHVDLGPARTWGS
jgi:hypothetical protein